MAYTEIHPIKSTLGKAIAYICNPEKTDGKLLISTFECSHETADIEFELTLAQTKIRKADRSVSRNCSPCNRGNNLAHHLIQSFDIGETTPEQAHEIGKKLADEVTGGKYEYVLTTHIDKGNLHNHIIFCAASFIDKKKYNSNKKSLYKIRKTSDRLCKEYGLSTIIPQNEKGGGKIEYTNEKGERVTRPAKNQARKGGEYNAEKQGVSYKTQLRDAIDYYIKQASDFEDFLRRMETDGFTIKRAKYHSYKVPDANEKTRFTGGPSLGSEYTDERIKERIKGIIKAPPKKRYQNKTYDGGINLITSIEENIKAQESKAYANKILITNLKIAAATTNYLTENNLILDWQLKDKIQEVATANQQTREMLVQLESKINDMGLLIKNIETYKRLKPIYDNYKKSKNKESFRNQHESDIILFEAAQKALKSVQNENGTLPNLDALRAEYKSIKGEHGKLKSEYNKLNKEVKKLDNLKRNVDKIIGSSWHEENTKNAKKKRKSVDL